MELRFVYHCRLQTTKREILILFQVVIRQAREN